MKLFIKAISQYTLKINAQNSFINLLFENLAITCSLVDHWLGIWDGLPLRAGHHKGCTVAPKHLMAEWRMMNESIRLTSAPISKQWKTACNYTLNCTVQGELQVSLVQCHLLPIQVKLAETGFFSSTLPTQEFLLAMCSVHFKRSVSRSPWGCLQTRVP